MSTQRESRFEEIDRVSRAVIQDQKTKREKKTARLRALRLAHEAAVVEPAAVKPVKRVPRKRSSKGDS